MHSLWKEILDNSNGYINDTYDEEHKMFAINIYQNNTTYLQENHQKINSDKVHNLFFVAARCSSVSTLSLLYDGFKINKDHQDIYGNNCLNIACSCNDSVSVIEYLIKVCKFNIEHTNNCGRNCLMLACSTNKNIEVIKYLIEEVQMNKEYKDNYDNTCLHLACLQNTHVHVIKYLVEECKMNVNQLNKFGRNCLMVACETNKNVDVVKYFIKELIMEKECKDMYGTHCLNLACFHNTFLPVIKYLVEECKMNVNQINEIGTNCLMSACQKNNNIDVIKYLIEEVQMNKECKNKYDNTCLHFACLDNTHVHVIKYLIEECKMNVNQLNKFGRNCLMLACEANKNVDVVKYFIEKLAMEKECKDSNGNNCLHLACRYNNNLGIIKYLVEDAKINVNAETNEKNCLQLLNDAYNDNSNNMSEQSDIIENATYLIEKTSIDFNLNKLEFQFFEKVLPRINNYNKINKICNQALSIYTINRVISVMQKINPLLLNSECRILANIIDPFTMIFNEFIKLVDSVKCSIDEESSIIKPHKKQKHNTQHISHDYSNIEPLFTHNNISYCGNRNVVYDSILCIKEIKESADFKDVIVLEGSLPSNIINMYINSCYTGVIELNQIKPIELIPFLKFIDQYPTTTLSIDLLENKIIDYIDKNNIEYNDTLKEFCFRYKLKYMYLQIHNKKVEK
jgi:hypothetical protein